MIFFIEKKKTRVLRTIARDEFDEKTPNCYGRTHSGKTRELDGWLLGCIARKARMSEKSALAVLYILEDEGRARRIIYNDCDAVTWRLTS